MQLSNEIEQVFKNNKAVRFYFDENKKTKWLLPTKHSLDDVLTEIGNNLPINAELGTITKFKQHGKPYTTGQSLKKPRFKKLAATTNKKLNGMENNDPLNLNTREIPKASPSQPMHQNIVPSGSDINSLMHYQIMQYQEKITELKDDLKSVKDENKTLEKENRDLRLFKETSETKTSLELERAKYNESNTLAGAIRELTKPDTAMALGNYIGGIKGGSSQLGSMPSEFADDYHKYLYAITKEMPSEHRAFIATYVGMMIGENKEDSEYQKFYKKAAATYGEFVNKVKPFQPK